jgi:hypothetical protein
MRNGTRCIGAVGLLAAALVCGCRHADRQQVCCEPGCSCVKAYSGDCPPDGECAPVPPVPAPAPKPKPPLKAPPSYLPDLVQTPQGTQQWLPPAAPAAMPTQPQQAPRSVTLDVAEVSEAPPSRPTPAGRILAPGILIHDGPPCPTEVRPAPAFVQTASTGMSFGHAPDYTWLRGQVQRSLHGVRLRFAPVDQVDRYGGSVTLVGDAQIEHLRDGQCVRVRGQLLNPDAKSPAPAYRVVAIE